MSYEAHEAYRYGCACLLCRYRRRLVGLAYGNLALSNTATTRESMERAFEKVMVEDAKRE